ncbi:MAG: substrate-binding domain-containing protein [Muribaculaceae bacterium]|nr:substrate-binding domain-containing protein [Muribaculaceae bacterium]
MKLTYPLIAALAPAALALASCGAGSSNEVSGPKVEKMVLASDATFQNIVDQEIDVFEYTYNTKKRQAYVIPYYVSQRAAFDSLLNLDNSVRTIITSRTLTADEKKYLRSHNLKPRERKIAVDAIALIVNDKNPQDVISLNELRSVLSGETRTWGEMWPTKLDSIRVIFDQNGSSVMQFLRDSICGGADFGPNVYAEQSARDVFDAVTSRPNALGIVSVSWISTDMNGTELSKDELRRRSSESDTTNLTFNPAVKVMAVAGDGSVQAYKPYQAYIFDGRYPLYRPIYITTTTVGGTLNNAFYSFVTGMQGQKVIQLTGVLPAVYQPRMVNVTTQGQ